MFSSTILNRNLVIPILLLLAAAGCSDSSTGSQGVNYDASDMLQNESHNVIVQTYVDLDTNAGNLVSAVQTLQGNPTKENLEAAQKQWRNTRAPWESSEAFLIGPVEDEQVDPHIDTWPLNQTDLDNVLNSDDEITEDYVTNLQNNLKGFHTIEYLLFGSSNDKTVDDFTSREFDYLIAAAKCLKNNTNHLVTIWKSGGSGYDNPYVNSLADAGNGSKMYSSQKKALEALISGMEGIADEVGNSKINEPYTQKDTSKVESQFSFNSKTDFQNNLRSIVHIYTGDYNDNSGPGVSNFVVQFDSKLDAQFKDELDAAITAVGNIQGNFRTAIIENRSSVADAQQAVRKVLSTIQEDIKPLLNDY